MTEQIVLHAEREKIHCGQIVLHAEREKIHCGLHRLTTNCFSQLFTAKLYKRLLKLKWGR